MHHELKTWPEPFQALFLFQKKFEFRKNDRSFQVGDTLTLLEWDNTINVYTGRRCTATVTYVLTEGFGLPEGYAILSLLNVSRRVETPLWDAYMQLTAPMSIPRNT